MSDKIVYEWKKNGYLYQIKRSEVESWLKVTLRNKVISGSAVSVNIADEIAHLASRVKELETELWLHRLK